MRMKGKKVIFDIKDTWSLNDTLKPVIHAGLVKFRQVIEDKDVFAGVPGDVLKDYYPDFDNGELPEGALELWWSLVDKMVYAFDADNEPNMEDFGVKFKGLESGQFSLDVTDEAAYELYSQARNEHFDKVTEGQLLFGKYYGNLWW